MQNWHKAAFAHSLGRSKSQARFQRWEKSLPSVGGDAKSHCRGPGYGTRVPGVTAAMFADSLPHSRYSIGPCEEGVINLISQIRALRLRTFGWLIPLFILSRLSIPVSWALMVLGCGYDPDTVSQGRELKTPKQTQEMNLRAAEVMGRAGARIRLGPLGLGGCPWAIHLTFLNLSFLISMGKQLQPSEGARREEQEVIQCLPNLRARNCLLLPFTPQRLPELQQRMCSASLALQPML